MLLLVMNCWQYVWLFGILWGTAMEVGMGQVSFDVNYDVVWGGDHVSILYGGREVQLSMDRQSGAGFGSKQSYGSGFFHMRVKLPNKDSSGVVTAFYLSSKGNMHDEVDFEFLGNKEGKPITLQTNVFANGQGNREERILLWFDPTADFHGYEILWNQHQIVFYVDEVPIRVFRNVTNETGVVYPTQAMQIEVSLWDGESWATDGGKTKTNWTSAPFAAHFQDFAVDGCPLNQSQPLVNRDDPITAQSCYALGYWWNQENYWKLDGNQQKELQHVRSTYRNYDYCNDTNRYPHPPPECAYNEQ